MYLRYTNINDVNTLYSLWVAKYIKNEFQNLQDLEEAEDSLLKFQFKFGYVEEQVFVAVTTWKVSQYGVFSGPYFPGTEYGDLRSK